MRNALQRLKDGISLAREGKDIAEKNEGLTTTKKALESIKVMKDTCDEMEVYKRIIPYDSDFEKLEQELKRAQETFLSNTFDSVPDDPKDSV